MNGLMKEIKARHERYADVAERYDVAPNTVWRWASGDLTPTLERARRLANDYGKSIEYLFDDTDNDSNPTRPRETRAKTKAA